MNADNHYSQALWRHPALSLQMAINQIHAIMTSLINDVRREFSVCAHRPCRAG